ncbi:MAG: hypothetical protein ACFFG0_16495 [Candidatus Thorarchaeota archaeon]
MKRLGLAEGQRYEVKDDIQESDIVEITLENAAQVFNSFNQPDYYCFAMKGGEHSQENICLKFNHYPLDSALTEPSETIPHNLIDFQMVKYEYSPSKDPPLIIR